MKLGVIDRDEYRQYRYWQTLQKIILPCVSGFGVAAVLLSGDEVRRLSALIAVMLAVMATYAVWAARALRRQMVRDLPQSLQSLLLFSSEAPGALGAALDKPEEGGA